MGYRRLRTWCAQRVPHPSPGLGTGHMLSWSLVFPRVKGPWKEGPGGPGGSTRQATRSFETLPAPTPCPSSLARTPVPEPHVWGAGEDADGAAERMEAMTQQSPVCQSPENHRRSPGTCGHVPPAERTQSGSSCRSRPRNMSVKRRFHIQMAAVRCTAGRQTTSHPQTPFLPHPWVPERPALGKLRSQHCPRASGGIGQKFAERMNCNTVKSTGCVCIFSPRAWCSAGIGLKQKCAGVSRKHLLGGRPGNRGGHAHAAPADVAALSPNLQQVEPGTNQVREAPSPQD